MTVEKDAYKKLRGEDERGTVIYAGKGTHLSFPFDYSSQNS